MAAAVALCVVPLLAALATLVAAVTQDAVALVYVSIACAVLAVPAGIAGALLLVRALAQER